MEIVQELNHNRNANIFEEDISLAAKQEVIDWEVLRGKTILITGATGLIGYTLLRVLAEADITRGLNVNVLALVRDRDAARERFKSVFGQGLRISMVEGTVECMPSIDGCIDYIVHGASKTQSSEFVKEPVEVIDTAILGTKKLLELAREKQVSSFVYLSSMEVYGFPEKGHKVTEEEIGAFSPMEIRNVYPISKLLCESMCVAYHKEYGVPVRILRLTQTFGPGIRSGDARVFAYFIECARDGKDIVLKTKGETERSYLYSADAATAILTLLTCGEAGGVYNAADESTYCSIKEMACLVAEQNGIGVQLETQDREESGYPETIYMDLDTTRLKALGWNACSGGGIEMMYRKCVEGLL